MSTIVSHSPLNILETVRDRGLVPRDHQYCVWESNGHVTDDATWPERSSHDPNMLSAQYRENSCLFTNIW